MQLQKFGYRADTVANGLEVIEAISRIAYDIILMDCQMPELDGYDAAKEIRRREGGKREIIIIAMTAAAMEEDRRRCFESGMDDYISKPVDPKRLAEVLAKWSERVESSQISIASD